MTFELFCVLLTIGSSISGLMTQALKKGFNISSNIIALLDAIIVGGIGTAIAYEIMGVEVSMRNFAYLVLMMVCIWLGSMVGYDKVIQTITQIKEEP